MLIVSQDNIILLRMTLVQDNGVSVGQKQDLSSVLRYFVLRRSIESPRKYDWFTNVVQPLIDNAGANQNFGAIN